MATAQSITVDKATIGGNVYDDRGPGGPAAGDLSGVFPNPVVASFSGTPFGDMAGQNSSAVAIGGGTITGLPSATDADQSAEVVAGMFTFTVAGTVNASTGWAQTTTGTITIGTTAQVFSQLSAAGQVAAGTGLSLSGSVMSLVTPVSKANGGNGT